MSDLRARARDIAAKLVWDNHGHYAMPRQDDITDAILRGMVEALEAEPDAAMSYAGVESDDNRTGHQTVMHIFRAMAAARAREIKEGE